MECYQSLTSGQGMLIDVCTKVRLAGHALQYTEKGAGVTTQGARPIVDVQYIDHPWLLVPYRYLFKDTSCAIRRWNKIGML